VSNPAKERKKMNEIMQNMDVNFSVDAEVDDIGIGGYWVLHRMTRRQPFFEFTGYINKAKKAILKK
jgi:hypothetical protein